jgi:NAD(P)H-dependent FMN reductase
VFQGKIAAVMSTSPGPLGGLRGLRGLRELLTNLGITLGITVLPNQLTIRGAFKAFDKEGRLVDDAQASRVEALGSELALATARLNPAP